MARKKPVYEIVRALFARSGNRCAFPNCTHLLINGKNQFIAQICHIEAANPEGERYNPSQTDEERRGYDNLILLCYEHHIETNDADLFPVDILQDMKRLHESQYSQDFILAPFLIEKISLDIQYFWEKIDYLKQSRAFPDMAVTVDAKASFYQLYTDIIELIKHLTIDTQEVGSYIKSNWINILTFLEKNGFDITPLGQLPYDKNPFFQAHWETIHLAIPNRLIYLNVNLTHMAVKYFELAIANNPSDSQLRDALSEIREILEDQVARWIVHD